MKTRSIRRGRASKLVAIASVGALLSVAPIRAAFAQTAPNLGAAASFGVLTDAAVTCADATIQGDVGTFAAATPVTRTRCTINGSIHAGDPIAVAAYADFLAAYAALAAIPAERCDAVLTGTLAGDVLPPGIYCFGAAATLTGQLTLDGPADGIWIFKVGTAGTGALTATNFSVVMSGGGQPCNVYWWVAEATTLTTSNLQGTILSGAATTLTGGSLIGRAFSMAAATLTGATAWACSPGTPPSTCKDFVTGGGWIIQPDGEKGTFAVTAGIRQDLPWGHLTFVDHGPKAAKVADMVVKGTGVTSYEVVDSMTRRITGTAEVDGVPGFSYLVDVTDASEPGRADSFTLQLSNGFGVSGILAGGNIQLHESCRPLTCRQPGDQGEVRGAREARASKKGSPGRR